MANLWHFISQIGLKHVDSIEEEKRIKLLNRVNALTIIVLFFYLIVELSIGIYAFLPFVLGMISLVLIDYCFIGSGRLMLAKHFAAINVMICISFFVLNTGNTFSESLFIPFVASPLVIFRCKSVSVYYLFAVLITLVALKFLQQFYVPLVILSEQEMFAFRVVNVCTSVIMTFILTYNFKRENEFHQHKLIEVNELVVEKNKEIIDSINYAKKIQQAYMPTEDLFYRIFKEAFLLYQPKDIVSGDFYWFYSPSKKVVLLAVADCTGHGVPGALMSVICCNALNEVAVNNNVSEPGEILNRTREIVKRNLKSSDLSGQKDGMDISLCRMDYTDYEEKGEVQVQWAGANNPLWLLSKSDPLTIAGQVKVTLGDEKIIEYKANKQPIGFHSSEQPFTNHSFRLKKGDTIYLFSDGFSDQFGGEKGKKLKDKNLQQLLLQYSGRSLKEQRLMLMDKFERWKGNLEQVDDVCIIALKI